MVYRARSANFSMISFLLFLFCAITTVHPAYDKSQCALCATTDLEGSWYVTGLPTYPSDMAFTESCLTASPPRMNSSCQGLCMEMTFPMNGQSQMVRGCYEEFFKADSKPAENETCEFSIGNGSTKIAERSTNTPVTAMRLCSWSSLPDGTSACNSRLFARSYVSADNGPLGGDRADLAFCMKENKPGGLSCKNCVRFGKQGSCPHDTSTTCNSGSYCSKLKGTIGGNDVEFRGCLPISPITGVKSASRCNQVKTKMDLPLLFGRGLSEDFVGDMCICADRAECNSSSHLQYFIFAFICIFKFYF